MWDASGILDDEIEALARRVLKQGAAFVCTWEPDCERVHDIFDRADRISDQVERGRPAESVVMTTWHAQEHVDEALWYALFAAATDGYFEETCRSLVVCTIGSPSEVEHLRHCLSDVDAFNREVLAEDEEGRE